jgi:hypothetical protein
MYTSKDAILLKEWKIVELLVNSYSDEQIIMLLRTSKRKINEVREKYWIWTKKKFNTKISGIDIDKAFERRKYKTTSHKIKLTNPSEIYEQIKVSVWNKLNKKMEIK